MFTSLAMRVSRGIAIALLLVSTHSFAETYYFQQSGFGSGGQITGWFEGKDINQDGMIVFWQGEVSDFSLSFSGNSIVPEFDYDFLDLMALNYEVGTPFLGDSNGTTLFTEGISAVRQLIGPRGYSYDTGYLPAFNGGAAIFSPTLELVETSPELVAISQVPEPKSQFIWAAGLVAILLIRRIGA